MRVAIIPARGGSRRIPRKNIRPFLGSPIIAYSINIAQRSGLFEGGVWVSTEDDEIAAVAERYGARIHRRRLIMAHNDVGTQDVVREVLRDLQSGGAKIEYACCIYATAPLMLAADLQRGYQVLTEKPDAPFVYSCALKPQRETGLLWDAGQWYWGKASMFLHGIPLDAPDVIKVVIPDERVCDINTENDWTAAEEKYRRMQDLVKASA